MDYSIINKLYPTAEKRWDFIKKCALSFNLGIDSVSHITGLDEKNVFSLFIDDGDMYRLFTCVTTDQTVALSKFNIFLTNLVQAYIVKKDKNATLELLRSLTKEERDASALIAKLKSTTGPKTYTDEDILIALRYQLKHYLFATNIEKIFGFDAKWYGRKVMSLENSYPDLVAEYVKLNENLSLLRDTHVGR